MNIPKLVLVEWEDACGLDTGKTWAETPDGEQTYTPLIMRSVGYVLHDSKAGIILTPVYSRECIAPREQIPRGMVRKITVLRKAETVVQ